jgi:hypothetical protein
MRKRHDLGYFGNIWVRQNVLEHAGDATGGHIHLFDHVSLLATGTVEVQIDDNPPRQFTAPTFIVIKKERPHKFTAITDNVLWYCVFAIRDIDGEVTDIVPETSCPYFINDASADYWDRRKVLESMSKDVATKPYPPDGSLYKWNNDSEDWVKIKT